MATLNVPWSDDESDNYEAHRSQHIDCKCEDHDLCTPDEQCSVRALAWDRRFRPGAKEA